MPNLTNALKSATDALPRHKLKDKTQRPLCPVCLQPWEEGGGLEGGGGAREMDWMDEDGVKGDTPLQIGRATKTPRRIAAILAALRQYPLINRAARIGGIAPRTLLTWRHDDPQLRADVEEAIEEGIERLELRAHEDAVHGSDREATLQRMFTLKRWRPEYRDNMTVHHQSGGQDARDAALLRRAMVEALGPFPEARAALAATLARLGGVASGDSHPALTASGPAAEEGRSPPAASDGDVLVVDAELVEVEVEPTADDQGERSRAGSAAHGGEERGSPGVDASDRTGAGGGGGPSLPASPSSPPNKGVGLFDNAVVKAHVDGDD